MKKEYVCIVCPRSCRLTVEEVEGNITVTGATCKRGEKHGVSEYTNPLRMLTTTVAIQNARSNRLSVVSSDEVPKQKMGECLEVLYKLMVTAPVKAGDVLVENICDTGVNIVAAHTL